MQLIYITRSCCPDRCPTSEQTTFIIANNNNNTSASASASAASAAASASGSGSGSGASANGNGRGGGIVGVSSVSVGDNNNNKMVAVKKKLHARDKVLSITDGCIEDMVGDDSNRVIG